MASCMYICLPYPRSIVLAPSLPASLLSLKRKTLLSITKPEIFRADPQGGHIY